MENSKKEVFNQELPIPLTSHLSLPTICVFFTDLFNKGGCETLIKYVVRSLYKEFSFYILTSLEGDRISDPEYREFLNYAVEIVNIHRRNQKALFQELKKIKPSLVFTSFFHFATEPCRRLDIPVVEFCVGARSMPKPQANPAHNYMTVESEGAKRQILKLRSFPEERIKVIRNAVCYRGEVASSKEIRKLFEVPEDFLIVSLNARAVSGKGWFVIGEAMKHLVNEKIIFIGFSRMEYVHCRVWSKLMEYNKKLKNFKVLDGTSVERKYVLGVTEASNFICIPTTHKEEGIPNCIVEALYFGKPVITCRNGYIEEVIFENKNGLFVKPHGFSLAGAIRLLIHNRELRENLSKGSKEVYESLYDIELFRNSYREVFLKALEDGYFYGNKKRKPLKAFLRNLNFIYGWGAPKY
ncbi:MAG TPA: glycosyltransferase family 4 protein [Candidatus Eremiobacteraeota bacterium]|nr:MAG: Glycosyl transferases group 1 [bacterium ADurb.Bin363]HPZ06563.1 glycosyltransferase family 4 protein [Candidatus Eremiobacteraeota bacterium]